VARELTAWQKAKITLSDSRKGSTNIHLLAEAYVKARKTVTGNPETSLQNGSKQSLKLLEE
jgi:hypothetical protein